MVESNSGSAAITAFCAASGSSERSIFIPQYGQKASFSEISEAHSLHVVMRIDLEQSGSALLDLKS